MRVGVVGLVLLTLGASPAAAADPAERRASSRVERTYRMSAAAERYYGPQVALPGVTEQVVVERGPRILVESDFFGLFEPVFATRRLPSRVRRVPVEAVVPLYEADDVGIRRDRRPRAER
jgi:hypothetical protein